MEIPFHSESSVISHAFFMVGFQMMMISNEEFQLPKKNHHCNVGGLRFGWCVSGGGLWCLMIILPWMICVMILNIFHFWFQTIFNLNKIWGKEVFNWVARFYRFIMTPSTFIYLDEVTWMSDYGSWKSDLGSFFFVW